MAVDDLSMVLTKDILENEKKIFLRKSDFKILDNQDWINEQKLGGGYCLTEDGLKDICRWKNKIKKVRSLKKDNIRKKKKDLKDIYFRLKEMNALDFKRSEKATEERNRIYKRAIKICSEVHWLHLPEYNENLIHGRACDPQLYTTKFYNHFHSIEALVKYLNHSRKKITKLGDINLEEEMNLIVKREYGNRTYTLKRTLKGWNVKYYFDYIKSSKDGNPGLIDNFSNDSISFPASIFDAFKDLWNIADKSDVKPETLQKYFNQLGEWISAVDKNKAAFLDPLYFYKSEKNK